MNQGLTQNQDLSHEPASHGVLQRWPSCCSWSACCLVSFTCRQLLWRQPAVCHVGRVSFRHRSEQIDFPCTTCERVECRKVLSTCAAARCVRQASVGRPAPLVPALRSEIPFGATMHHSSRCSTQLLLLPSRIQGRSRVRLTNGRDVSAHDRRWRAVGHASDTVSRRAVMLEARDVNVPVSWSELFRHIRVPDHKPVFWQDEMGRKKYVRLQKCRGNCSTSHTPLASKCSFLASTVHQCHKVSLELSES